MLEQLCPWSNFEPATISFCEERLCSWVVEPANTWSNIGYLLAAIYVANLAKKQNENSLNFYTLTLVFLGLGSALFHATGTFWGEFIDLSGMYLLSSTFLTINLKQYFQLSSGKTQLTYWMTVLSALILLLLFKPLGILIFSIQFAISLLIELRLFQKGSPKNIYLIQALGLFALAFAIWVTDKKHWICDPQNHFFNGHALWHLLTALSIVQFYKYYQGLLPIQSQR